MTRRSRTWGWPLSLPTRGTGASATAAAINVFGPTAVDWLPFFALGSLFGAESLF